MTRLFSRGNQPGLFVLIAAAAIGTLGHGLHGIGLGLSTIGKAFSPPPWPTSRDLDEIAFARIEAFDKRRQEIERRGLFR